jgi:hypothetical protein
MIVPKDIFTPGNVVLVHVLKVNGVVDLEVDCCNWSAITHLDLRIGTRHVAKCNVLHYCIYSTMGSVHTENDCK